MLCSIQALKRQGQYCDELELFERARGHLSSAARLSRPVGHLHKLQLLNTDTINSFFTTPCVFLEPKFREKAYTQA